MRRAAWAIGLLLGAAVAAAQPSGRVYPPFYDVRSFGATCNGTSDDTTPIQNAINALPSYGGTVYFPPGKCNISSTINVGNGSTAAPSTVSSIKLIGNGGPTNIAFGNAKAGTSLVWLGGASVMVDFKGPISGAQMQNFLLDGGGTANTCLRTDTLERSYVANVECQNFLSEGVIITAYDNVTGFSDGANQNVFVNLTVLSTAAAVVTGVRVGENTRGAGTQADVAQNEFLGLNIRCMGRGSTGLKLQYLDASQFLGSTVTATIPVDIVPPSGSGGTSFPAAIAFSGFTGNGSLTDTITAATNATPIVVTTSVNHGRRQGDWVGILGANGNTAANGVWYLSAVTSNTMTLSGSVGNGVWSSGGTVQGSGFQQTSGTWIAGAGNTSGILCIGLNTEGYENLGGYPPAALTGISGTTLGGISFGSTSRDNVFTAITASNAFTTTGSLASFTGGGSQYTIQPNFLNRAGVVCLIQYYGVYTTDATPGRTLQLQVRVGGNVIAATTLTMGTSATNLPFQAWGEVSVRATGSSGVIAITGSGFGAAGGAATQFATGASGARTYTVNLTSSLVVDIQGNWSAASQSATLDGVKVYIMPARQSL